MNQIQDYPLDLSLPKKRNPEVNTKSKYNPSTDSFFPKRRCGKQLLACEICLKKFDRPSLLKRHARTHTGMSKKYFFRIRFKRILQIR